MSGSTPSSVNSSSQFPADGTGPGARRVTPSGGTLHERTTMPEPVELLDGVVKHEDTIEIRWRFKANLSREIRRSTSVRSR
jgi:hypothetical protein